MSTTEIYSHLVKSNLNRRPHQFMESGGGITHLIGWMTDRVGDFGWLAPALDACTLSDDFLTLRLLHKRGHHDSHRIKMKEAIGKWLLTELDPSNSWDFADRKALQNGDLDALGVKIRSIEQKGRTATFSAIVIAVALAGVGLWQVLRILEIIPGGDPADMSAILYLVGAGSIFGLLRVRRDERIRSTLATVIALDRLEESQVDFPNLPAEKTD
ncbi:MAG: hypothetical protein ACI80V_000133 [Rhodothermales bacterium]|jgi:hypothetical protein